MSDKAVCRVLQSKGGFWYAMTALPDKPKPGCFFFDGTNVHFDEADKKVKKRIEYEVREYRVKTSVRSKKVELP